MSEQTLILISIILFLLPLTGFAANILAGKRIKKLYFYEILVMCADFVLASVLAFCKLAYYGEKNINWAFNWFSIKNIPLYGNMDIEMGVQLTNITVIMLFVVCTISALVHIYSTEYMKGDPKFSRYYAYLGLFTFSMLGIVIANNILGMYVCWELVGITSYLLIGFWYEKKEPADAGKKAFLFNRVGDMCMFAGIMILFTTYHTFTFDKIFLQMSHGLLPFNSAFWLTLTGLLVFMGAVGKSAQFPLHVWLPDAMEGPTPVSALIHAATMVAAGVYMLTKIFVMLTGDAMIVIACVGAITSILAATIALTQPDIKKVLAFSTVSQLGYMVMSIGVGAYQFAFFHLVTHAFFKACLFLGAGAIMNAMHHEQDMRQMGGLRKKLPITYAAFLVTTFAITGIPLTSGFLSKDGLLAGTLVFGKLTGHWLIPLVGFTVAMLTAFYMFRLIIMTFHGEPRNKEKYDHIKGENPWTVTMPLMVLSVLSLFVWYSPNPFNPEAGPFLSKWVKTPQTVVPESARIDFMQTANDAKYQEQKPGEQEEIVHSRIYTETMHQAHVPAMALSLLLGGFGILMAFVTYQWKKINADKVAQAIKPLYNGSLHRWYIDEIYAHSAIGGTMLLSRGLAWFDLTVVDGLVNGFAWLGRLSGVLSSWFDATVVDGLVNLTALLSGLLGAGFRKFQNGRVQTYILYLICSIVLLLILFRPF